DDIYFTANMAPNKLYLNKGNMRFVDITAQSGAGGNESPWKTGVTMADVNGDGKLDLYISRSGTIRPENRIPELLINDGPDAQGITHFTTRTTEYGLAQPVQSTQGVFFDYDRDGDLDLFQLNHNPRLLPILDPSATAAIMKQPDPQIGVRLYKNTGNHFTDVTAKSGLSSSPLSYGLGIGVSDLNNDGWPDLYVSNDYGVPDYLYINNRDGTFSEIAQLAGVSKTDWSWCPLIADFDNDGYKDIYISNGYLRDYTNKDFLRYWGDYKIKKAMAREPFLLMDLVTAMPSTAVPDYVFKNEGNLTFSNKQQEWGLNQTNMSNGAIYADLDNDGDLDLVVNTINQPASIYRNHSTDVH
ncbi:MAG: VCBS repeat-containing protein, partial [Cytophagaceae bacterium]